MPQWNPDLAVHEKAVQIITDVAYEKNQVARFRRALGEIAAASSTFPYNTDFRRWCGTVAMAALYPDDFQKGDK